MPLLLVFLLLTPSIVTEEREWFVSTGEMVPPLHWDSIDVTYLMHLELLGVSILTLWQVDTYYTISTNLFIVLKNLFPCMHTCCIQVKPHQSPVPLSPLLLTEQ